MSKLLQNREVVKSGKYILTRTDDVVFGVSTDKLIYHCETEVVKILDEAYLKERVLLGDLSTPISSFDPECRWELVEANEESQGISAHWVLNQLSGMHFVNKAGTDAYDYMKRCLKASFVADCQSTEADKESPEGT